MCKPILGQDIQYDEIDTLLSVDVLNYVERIMPDSIMTLNRIHNPVNFDTTLYMRPVLDCWVCSGSWQSRLFDSRIMDIGQTITKTYSYDPLLGTKDSLVIPKTYDYNQYGAYSRLSWTDSKGKQFRKLYRYTHDYGNVSPALASLNDDGLRHLVSTETWRYDGPDSVLIDLELKVPYYDPLHPDNLTFKGVYKTTLQWPMSNIDIVFAGGLNNLIDRTAALNLTVPAGNRFLQTELATRYDSKNNVTEARFNQISTYHSKIWDTRNGNLLAEVSNAQFADIAHTSFEGIYNSFGIADENKGNLDFDAGNIVNAASSITGKAYLELVPGHGSSDAIRTQALQAKEYIFSFWTTDNPGSFLQLSLISSSSGTPLTTTVVNTVGIWKLRMARFTAAAGDYVELRNVPGSGPTPSVFIDEVRLYPVGASMVTQTYKPLLGAGSACDGDNYITYFEYDMMGRQAVTRDMRGNILSVTETGVNHPDTYSSSPIQTY